MISLKNQKNRKTASSNIGVKIRAVIVNDRGQIVIPDDIRTDLGIEAGSALVLIQKGNEITMKKESDFLRRMKK